MHSQIPGAVLPESLIREQLLTSREALQAYANRESRKSSQARCPARFGLSVLPSSGNESGLIQAGRGFLIHERDTGMPTGEELCPVADDELALDRLARLKLGDLALLAWDVLGGEIDPQGPHAIAAVDDRGDDDHVLGVLGVAKLDVGGEARRGSQVRTSFPRADKAGSVPPMFPA